MLFCRPGGNDEALPSLRSSPPPFPMNPSTNFPLLRHGNCESLARARNCRIAPLCCFTASAAMLGRFPLYAAVRTPFPHESIHEFSFLRHGNSKSPERARKYRHCRVIPLCCFAVPATMTERSPLCTAARTSYDLQIRNSSYTRKSLPTIPSHGFIPTVPVYRGKINSCTGLPNSSVSLPSTNPSRL